MANTNLAINIIANDMASGKLKRLGKTAGRVGKTGMMGLATAGVAVAGGLAYSVKEAANFEEAMVEVEKVTDPKTAEEMGKAVRGMAKEMPMAREKLAGLAADAARFGVKGTENLEKFTEASAMMSIATDLTADRAGVAFAKLTTITGTPVDEVENLGSAINELSNNVAASSSEIVDSMLRGANEMEMFGLTQTEIVGVSGALNAVSESAERSGSRLRRLFSEMVKPDKVRELSAAMGMTVDDFIEMKNNSPISVLKKMVSTMKKGREGAKKFESILSEVSLKGLKGLTKNSEGLNEALDMSAEAYEENTSLSDEYATASDILKAKVKILGNKLSDMALTIGDKLRPHIENMVDWFNQNLKPALEKIRDKIVEAKDKIVDFFTETEVGQTIIEGFERVTKGLKDELEKLSKGFEDNDGAMGNLITTAGVLVVLFALGLYGALVAVIFILRNVYGWFVSLGAGAERVGYWIGYMTTTAILNFISFWANVRRYIGGAINYIGDLIDKLKEVRWRASLLGGAFGPIGFFGGLAFNAEGVKNFQGGLSVVGEKGPEIVNLPKGSDVIPNDEIGKMGNNVTVNIYGNINNEKGYTPEKISQMIGREIELSMQGVR